MQNKILKVLEFICYLISLLSIYAVIFAFKKGFSYEGVLMIFTFLILIRGALEARTSRDNKKITI